jgi:hypothetical protein
VSVAAPPHATSNRSQCSAEGCDRPIHSRHLCNRCYHRRYADGSLVVLTPWRDPGQDALDEMSVARTVLGDPPAELHRYDRREAVRRLRADGLSYSQIARRIRVPDRTVGRDLVWLGMTKPRRYVRQVERAKAHGRTR